MSLHDCIGVPARHEIFFKLTEDVPRLTRDPTAWKDARCLVKNDTDVGRASENTMDVELKRPVHKGNDIRYVIGEWHDYTFQTSNKDLDSTVIDEISHMTIGLNIQLNNENKDTISSERNKTKSVRTINSVSHVSDFIDLNISTEIDEVHSETSTIGSAKLGVIEARKTINSEHLGAARTHTNTLKLKACINTVMLH